MTFGFQIGDVITASIFNNANVLLGTVAITGNMTVNFGAIAGITRLFLDDASLAAGIAVDGFQFNQGIVQAPEPTTMLLLGLGLSAAAVRRRRIAKGV